MARDRVLTTTVSARSTRREVSVCLAMAFAGVRGAGGGAGAAVGRGDDDAVAGRWLSATAADCALRVASWAATAVASSVRATAVAFKQHEVRKGKIVYLELDNEGRRVNDLPSSFVDPSAHTNNEEKMV